MPTTPNYNLPYPVLSDPADVPTDMGELAIAVDNAILATAGGLPADTVVAAGVRIIANKLAAGDTQPAWRVMGDGKLEWGPGGATAPDTNLYRGWIDLLKTDDQFMVERPTAASGALLIGLPGDTNGRWAAYGDGKLEWGAGGASAFDVNLYRGSGPNLQSDSYLRIARVALGFHVFQAMVTGDANPRLAIRTNGDIVFNDPTGANYDTNLFRSAANNLATDDAFSIFYDGADLSSTDTGLLINFKGLGMRRVVADAADSGGTGYRQLRIAN